MQTSLTGEIAEKTEYKLPDIDIFICGSIPLKVPMCCLATAFGFKLGMRSDKDFKCQNDQIQFIDNDFMNYDHEKHLAALDKYNPKTTSIVDYFSEKQCQELNLKYHPIEEIVAFAEDANKYCERVILIPKSETGLKEIVNVLKPGWIVGRPNGEAFGKSKPIPLASYLEYDIELHLLGGNPKEQVANYRAARDHVVSMDSSFISTHTIKKIYWSPLVAPEENFVKRAVALPGAGYAPFMTLCALNLSNYYRYLAKECSL